MLGSGIPPSHVYEFEVICFAYLFVILLFFSLHEVLQELRYRTYITTGSSTQPDDKCLFTLPSACGLLCLCQTNKQTNIIRVKPFSEELPSEIVVSLSSVVSDSIIGVN
jgi:hypothetical protein